MGSKNGKPVLREEDITSLMSSSGKDRAEVQAAFDAWVAEHPNGKMKPKDFREMMSQALPKKDAGKMEKHVFRIYDSNNDGYIDFQEFMVIFYCMADGTPEEVLGKIFRYCSEMWCKQLSLFVFVNCSLSCNENMKLRL